MEISTDKQKNNMVYKIIQKAEECGSSVISFDIFGTIVLRNCKDATDVFDMAASRLDKEIGNTFKAQRIIAEREARKATDQEDVTLDEIYSYLPYADTIKTQVKELELQCEYDLCTSNRVIVDAIEKLHEMNYKIIITSDMYLPASQIKRMLNKCGVTDYMYDQLYISGEIGFTKRSGQLFNYIATELNTHCDSFLHIGDHKNNDYIMPINNGWHAMLIDKVFYRCHFKTIENFTDNIIYGISNNLIINNRNIDANSNISGYEIGAQLLGPFVYIYIYWLHSMVEKCKIDKIFFLSREGWLLYQIYKKIFPDYENAYYFHANRNSLLSPLLHVGSSPESYIRSFPRPHGEGKYTIKELLRPLFIRDDDAEYSKKLSQLGISNVNYELDLSVAHKDKYFIECYKSAVECNRDFYQQQHDLFFKYLNRCNGTGRIALVNNSMSSGAQWRLNELAGKQASFINFQFIRRILNPELNMEHYVFWKDRESQFNKRLFFISCLLFESLLFPDEGTDLSYEENENGQVNAVTRNTDPIVLSKNRKILNEIRRGAIDFIECIKNYDIPADKLSSHKALLAWNDFYLFPTYEEAVAIHNLVNADEKTENFICDAMNPIVAHKKSRWKQGTYVYGKHKALLLLDNLSLKIRLLKRKFY